MKNLLKLIALTAVLIGFQINPAAAGGNLTLTTTEGDSVRVSMEELMELPATEITTSTQWTDGVQEFRGVSFELLLDRYDIDSETVRVTALNDYNVVVPTKVLREDGAILAYHLNGSEMSVREKGPFWVIFPYDDDPRFQTDTYWSYSVWQVKSVDEAN